MIFVARTACPKPLDPLNETSAGAKELAAAKKRFEEHGEPPAGASFKAYAHDAVRQALIDMFHGKCAYCETDTAAGSDADIEHYRPKGGVSDAADHPGYWWLAMDWSNLVLSCAHCNQERRQLGLDPDMSVEQIKQAIAENDRRTTGKKNAFPTANNKWVTSHRKKVAGEKPLLIDPTMTDPEPLFEWVVAGEFSTIRAKDGDPRADATWRVLGLNRRRLTEARGKMLGLLALLTQNVRDALERMRAAPTEQVAALAYEEAARYVDVLRGFCAPKMPYAALARSYLKEVEAMMKSAV